MGFQEYSTDVHEAEAVNLYFTQRMKLKDLNQLVHTGKRIVKANHFPLAGYLCIKDSLYRMLKKQRVLHGNAYNFVPLTFILPNEYSKFIDTFHGGSRESS